MGVGVAVDVAVAVGVAVGSGVTVGVLVGDGVAVDAWVGDGVAVAAATTGAGVEAGAALPGVQAVTSTAKSVTIVKMSDL